jgi:uncharacterized membrane protein YdjX (TVP38/TMEM64 family)
MNRRSAVLTAAGAVGLIVVLAILARHFLTLDQVVRFVQGARTNPLAPLLFMSTYILFCLFAPISVFPVAGGVLFGFWRGLLYNTIGVNGGAMVAFWISRRFRGRYGARVSAGKLKAFNDQVSRRGLVSILAMRAVGLPPFIVVNYLSGLSDIRARDFLLGSFLGMLPWKIVVTYSAGTLWNVLQTAGVSGLEVALRHLGAPITGIFAAAGSLVFLVHLVRKYVLKRRERQALPKSPIIPS